MPASWCCVMASPIQEALEAAKAIRDNEADMGTEMVWDALTRPHVLPGVIAALLEAVQALEQARCTPTGSDALIWDEIADKAYERVKALLSSKGGRG